MKRLSLMLLFLLLFYSGAKAATYTVCSSGCDYTTLSAAASGVPSGANHTILVSAGTYAGFTDSRSGPGSTPEADTSYRIWKADGIVNITSMVTINAAWVKLDGFRFSAVGVKAINTTGSPNASNCWFTNLTIVGTSGDYSGMVINGTDNIITDCDLSDLYDYFPTYGSGHIFRGNYIHNHISRTSSSQHSDVWQSPNTDSGALPASNITIERNHVFLGNDSTGKLSTQNVGALHVFMWEDTTAHHASGLVIRNNIFESNGWFNSDQGHPDGLRIYNNIWRADDDQDNTGSAPIVIAYSTSGCDDVEIRNNLFIDKTQAVSYGAGVTNKKNSNNLFWRYDGGSMANVNYTGTNDITGTDPKFSSYDNDIYNVTTGYQLQSSSPAKDTGYDLAGIVTDDYAGTSRPQGSAYDIGAYEYAGVPRAPILKSVSFTGGQIQAGGQVE